jgi:hypothetical protein
MFKSFVHSAFHNAPHFHQLPLKQNRSWHESKLEPSSAHLCSQLLSRRIRSWLAMHFPVLMLLLAGKAEADPDTDSDANEEFSEWWRM